MTPISLPALKELYGKATRKGWTWKDNEDLETAMFHAFPALLERLESAEGALGAIPCQKQEWDIREDVSDFVECGGKCVRCAHLAKWQEEGK